MRSDGVRGSLGSIWRAERLSDALSAPVTGFLAALLLCLAAVLLLRGEPPSRPRVRSILLDVSASVTRISPSSSRVMRAALAREAERARDENEEVLVVAASADCRQVFGPGDPMRLLDLLEGRSGEPLDPTGTGVPVGADLESALARGVRLIGDTLSSHGASGGSLVLVGDGSFTGDDPAPQIERLRGMGVDWLGLDLVPRERFDAAVIDLRAARHVESGAPVSATAVVLLRPGSEGDPELVLEVVVEGASDRREFEQALDLDPFVPKAVTVQLGALADGRARVRARVRPRAGLDPVPENDEIEVSVRVGGGLVVGVVRPKELGAVASEFFGPTLQGVEFVPLLPGELSTALGALDAVLALDVPLDDLPGDLLRTFVRTGGGLLVSGGYRALAGWSSAPRTGELAEILPLWPDPGEDEPRRVVVLVDGSGSMEGEPFELVRDAARELVRCAPPRDEIELRFFTAMLHDAVELRRDDASSTDVAELVGQVLDARAPSGSTRIVESLEQLVRERELEGGRSLVLLLTDGRESPYVVRAEERARGAATALAAARTDLVVFAVGPGADRSFLAWLAGREQAVRSTEDLADLFRSEVNRERTRQGEIGVLPLGGGLADQVLAPRTRFEPIARHLRCVPAPGAEVALVSDDGEPILGVARWSEGRTAALATLPFGDWAPRWSGRSADFAPLVRWLARRHGAGTPTLELNGTRLVLRGAEGLPPRVVASLRVGPGLVTSHSLVFTREAATPGVLGAEIPEGVVRQERGVVEIDVGPSGESLVLTVVWPRPVEFSEPRPRLALAPAQASGPLVGISGRDDVGRREPSPTASGLLVTGTIAVLLAGLAFALPRRRRAAPRQAPGVASR